MTEADADFWPDAPGDADDEISFEDLLVDDTDLPPDHRSGYIAVVGRPNVGKSTLMNAYLGQRIAITSPKPQTTRDRLLGILTLPEAQLVFNDTPGIHDPHHSFGRYMVEAAVNTIPDADLILWLVDGSAPPHEQDLLVAEAIRAAGSQAVVILAMNKIDLLAPELMSERLAAFEALLDVDLALPISATRGDNRGRLLQAIIDHLPAGPRFFPEEQVTDLQERFIAAELVREAALQALHQEVPHALALRVDEFKRRSEKMTYIAATIFVERNSQKGIVIGRRGAMLKQIGQLARPKIEALVGTKVFLDLRVKVLPNWRKKKEALKRFGYVVD